MVKIEISHFDLDTWQNATTYVERTVKVCSTVGRIGCMILIKKNFYKALAIKAFFAF